MNKIVIAVVAVVVLAGIAYFLMNSSGGGGATNTENSRGTLASLMAKGPSRCEVTHTQEGASSTGIVYIAGGKMRGDFTSTMQGQAVDSHMISDGQFVYTWSSAMPQGVKIAVDATASASASANQQAAMYNQSVDYNCTPWNTDPSQFQLPSGVTFTDLSTMMQGGASGSGSAGVGVGMNCAMCDSAPAGQAREQCRAALNCK